MPGRIIVRVADEETERRRSGRRHLQPDEVHPLQPEHLHQPDGRWSRKGDRHRAGRHPRRWPLHRHGGTGARARTCASRSCRGTATTSRIRCSSPSGSWQEDRFTSVHIQELTCIARDTKLGPEEITCDIPNVGESALAKLDESGIVYIGAEVVAGRHPGRQGDAEGRNAVDAGREAPAGHLRREGLRREGHLAPRAHRGQGHHHRRSRVHPGRRREGPAGDGPGAGGGTRRDPQGPRRRIPYCRDGDV